ncbi:hypothetical protein [Pseudomonas piscis]|uniref:Ferric oxidoreductase domain-containing protein n=1 Tax=Pseudomonas piscis TaxID=2614538 RepID=A0A7X1U3C5_9PSED|nr:hypothetical protein [Pseudomonas piscis]MQA53084.1 hypothetical protein [Pseudomonas piscis]
MTTSSYYGKWHEGWYLCASLTTVVVVAALAILAIQPDITGIRNVAVFSARCALFLFCTAFASGALHALWPAPLTHWLKRNRRHLGVAFATAHTVHLSAVIAFAIEAPTLFDTAKPPFIFSILGAIGYLFMYAMVATSFDYTAILLGRKLWQLLHWIGSYYLWSMFISAFTIYTLHRPTIELHVILCVGLLLIAYGLRIAVRIKRSQFKVQGTAAH